MVANLRAIVAPIVDGTPICIKPCKILPAAFCSAISSKGRNQSTLMVVLGFPIVVPQILLLIKCTEYSFLSSGWENVWPSLSILLAIDAILISLSYLLFPYLWRS